MPKTKKFDSDNVLQAASSIFRKSGFNGTSIDDILKATGLSRSSLYDEFKDKHSLYLKALEYYRQEEAKQLHEVAVKKLNGLEKIEYVFNYAVECLIKNPNDNGCLMVNAASEMSRLCEKTTSIVQSNKEDIQKMFALWLNEAQKNSEIKLSKPAAALSSYLYSALCGLKVLSQGGSSKSEMMSVVKTTMAAIAK